MNIAKKLCKYAGRPDGDAAVYELDPPVDYFEDWGSDKKSSTAYVVVSAVPHVLTQGPETYIFPVEKTGDVFTVVDYSELEGSFKGSMDHAKALEGLGYAIEA